MEQPVEDQDAGVRLAWWNSKGEKCFTLVSECDVHRVTGISVWMHPSGYVSCDRYPYRFLHNFILQHSDPERPIDHINNKRWDNRRSNLRILTRAENTDRPRRLDETEARLYEDYQEGRIMASELRRKLREHRDAS